METDGVPEEFVAIRSDVDSLCRELEFGTVEEFEARARALDAKSLATAIAACNWLAEEGRSAAVSAWIDRVVAINNRASKRHPSRRFFCFFGLCSTLANMGFSPFTDGRVQYDSEVEADWNTVPEELRYLKEAGDRFACVYTEGGARELAESASASDRSLIAGIAEKIRSLNHCHLIFSITDSRGPLSEAEERVGNLVAILRAFNLNFGEDD